MELNICLALQANKFGILFFRRSATRGYRDSTFQVACFTFILLGNIISQSERLAFYTTRGWCDLRLAFFACQMYGVVSYFILVLPYRQINSMVYSSAGLRPAVMEIRLFKSLASAFILLANVIPKSERLHFHNRGS